MTQKDKYYDETSAGYDRLHGDEQLVKLMLISQNLKIHQLDTLLDVGCGTGISTRFWECQRMGIDPSEAMIAVASKNDDEGRYLVEKAEQLPFENDCFDYVISVTAVHNFTDIEKGLKEIRRVAKIGKENIVLSILKQSKKFSEIEKTIKNLFRIKTILLSEKDVIFFVQKEAKVIV